MRKTTFMLIAFVLFGYIAAIAQAYESYTPVGSKQKIGLAGLSQSNDLLAPYKHAGNREFKPDNSTPKPVPTKSGNAILTEGFEGTFPPTGWTMIDNDGDAQNWFAFNNATAAHSGTYSAQSASWSSSTGPLTPDNWLITPQLSITSANFSLKYWIGAQDPSWKSEKYEVRVSTTGNAVANFTNVVYGPQVLTTAAWQQITVNLAAFAGQQIYIAFRHYDCTDWFRIKLDDVLVEEAATPPSCASNPLPANNATNWITATPLTWGAVSGATSYDVYWGTTLPGTITQNVTGPEYLPVMAPNTSYEWKVVPRNGIGPATGCPTWSYTTGEQAYLLSPNPVSTCAGVYLDDGGEYNNYDPSQDVIQVFTPSIPGNKLNFDFVYWALDDDGVPSDYLEIYDGTSTTAPLIGTYTATSPGMVEATNADGALTFHFVSDQYIGDEGWKAIITCVSYSNPPNCATNPTPANGATNVIMGSSLTWNATGADSYDVYFGTDPNPPFVQNVTVKSYTPTMSPTTQYYWKVVPKNAAGDASGCPVWSFTSGAQIYLMNNTPVTTCSGTFYDSGGPTGQYANNEDFTKVFTPSTAGAKMQVTFTAFDVESGWDYLYIYDGSSTTAPQITGSPFSGTTIPAPYTATNATGALTFKFTSDGSVPSNGWEATLSCFTPSAFDAGLTAIVAPTGLINAGNYDVIVKLKNFGTSAFTDCDINYTIGSTSGTYSWTGNLAPNAEVNVTIVNGHPFTTGNTTISATVVLAGDGNAANNTVSGSVFVEPTPIYSNGPLVTHPGAGPEGTDISQLHSGLTSFGSNINNGGGYRIADDFEVPAGEQWTINAVAFFGYQTGSTTTSTFNHANYKIWNGSPNAGGTVLLDNSTSNQLTLSVFSNIYRTASGDVTSTNRPIMKNICTFGTPVVLTPGTYSIDWALGGTLTSGPWSPAITILGQTTTGNAIQWNGTTWTEIVDGTYPQGHPFNLYGSISYVSGNDAGISAITPNGATSTCTSGIENVVATLKNYSSDPLTSATIEWSVNGVSQTPYNWTGNIAAGGTANITLGNYDFTNAAVYTIIATATLPNGGADQNASNDSKTVTYEVIQAALEITENFDALTPPALPTGWSVVTNGVAWRTVVGGGTQPDANSAPNMIVTYYNATNPKNDWFFTKSLNLVAGTNYKLSFYYDAPGWEGTPEKMKVTLNSAPNATSILQTLWDNSTMETTGYELAEIEFNAPSSGCYYIGWHAYSDADVDYISVDDIQLEIVQSAKKPIANNKVSIFPVPTKGKLNIETGSLSSAKISVMNLVGEVIIVKENVNGTAEFDLTNLAKGIYLVKIVSNDQIITKKITLID